MNGNRETRYDRQHYVPLLQRKPGASRNGAPFADLPEPLQRLRRGLVRNPGGDRVMAQVVANALTAGPEAILVAVELALEVGPPGRVSIQHVIMRVPAHDGHDSGPMADTILAAWRTAFRLDGGHFGGQSGTLSAMIPERYPLSAARSD